MSDNDSQNGKTVAYIAIRLTPKHIFHKAGQAKFLQMKQSEEQEITLFMRLSMVLMCSGDASSTSRHDMLLVVEDARAFHRRNMSLARSDYGSPRSVGLSYLSK